METEVEEAAMDSCVFDKNIYNDNYQPYYIEGFKAGAEWQANQSPWISVEERLPEDNEEVLVLYEYRGQVFISTSRYFGESNWSHGDSKILAWMPIPTFDQILEANKDVLQRLKEKGD